jgi:hypothetical protein
VVLRAGTHVTADLLNPGPWVDLPLLNGWAAIAGAYVPSFRRVILGKRIEIVGTASGGTGTNGTVVANLPVGSRPSLEQSLPLATNRGLSAVLVIKPTGDMQLAHLLSTDPTKLMFSGSFPLSL